MRKQPQLERVRRLPLQPVKSVLRQTPVRPDLSIEQILKWADEYFKRHGYWPNVRSGYIPGTIDDNWRRIDQALRVGTRSLARNSNLSLARLLEQKREVRNKMYPPRLTVREILNWSIVHHKRTGQWPSSESGQVFDVKEENWNAIDAALRNGSRGLPPNSSLPRLLAEHCGVPNRSDPPRLSTSNILAWCDAHRRRTGQWPTNNSECVAEAPEETWRALDAALRNGARGLAGNSSLAQLLAHKRGKRTHGVNCPQLSESQILSWCDAYRKRTGNWPNRTSGAIHGTGESWSIVDAALRAGNRGLNGGTSLARLLARARDVKNRTAIQKLTCSQILEWADAHQLRHGRWPNVNSGPIEGTIDDTWARIDDALRIGHRGLARGSGMSLARLLEQQRGVRNSEYPPKLSRKQILIWAKAHRRRSGKWPTADSGPIIDAPGETWLAMDMALRMGRRGLPGGSSLHRFLCK